MYEKYDLSIAKIKWCAYKKMHLSKLGDNH